MSQSLVSIITPCYNGGKYVYRLLDSVLAQTHKKIEMIVIDDGSTDGSADIIRSYIPKFSQKGYDLKYLYQENQGQSVAVNVGLKQAKGAYLVWPDADDYYSRDNAIAEMVKALEHSDKQTSMVRVQCDVLDEKGEIITRLGVNDETRYKYDLFEDCLFGYGVSFWGAAGGYMVKVEKIDELIPGRDIYTEKGAGQNWQLCLPLLYMNKCITIEEFLYSIVTHSDSHSREMETNSIRQQVYYRTIKNTLNRIPLDVDYKMYLLDKVRDMTDRNCGASLRKRPYRKYIKRVMKAVVPYGLMVIYKRGSR